jgi:hypothetical protein
MTNQQSDAVREQLREAVVILRPYAMSSGPFHDPQDPARGNHSRPARLGASAKASQSDHVLKP